MFYSQFILAKKGPLGTIWIAAHLERKLRKNQVADTDIGVSVDSIIFPEVPIALRLSSHLMLGVVRIYSRKVNYLFHDCSEALLKIKQAFRSTAVDLPPEESTAPYHSITLPETFHLDDFELPEDAFQGDFDHHVSTKEQITLQDNPEKTGYSTSQFGLDERFGDGNSSHIGLDLEEELMLNKDHSIQLEADDGIIIQGRSAVHATDMEVDNQNKDESAEGYNMEDRPSSHNKLNLLSADGLVGNSVPNWHTYNVQTPDLNDMLLNNDGNAGPSASYYQPSPFPCDEPTSPEFVSAQAPATPGLMEETVPSRVHESPVLSPQRKASPSSNDETAKTTENANVLVGDEATELGLTKPVQIESSGAVQEIDSLSQQCATGELPPQSEISNLEATMDKAVMNTDNLAASGEAIGARETAKDMPLVENSLELSADIPIEPVIKNQTQFNDGSVDVQEGSQHAPPVIIASADSQVNVETSTQEIASNDRPNDLSTLEFPEREKMLSAPDVEFYQANDLGQVTAEKGTTESDGSNKVGSLTSRKRHLEDSLPAPESATTEKLSSRSRGKRTIDDIPDDDDLLASILVGRRTPGLRLGSTPILSKASSLKRPRLASKTTTPKRKVQMDDAMVIHADTIRQQLISTEDIRRIRKKAPCTRSEIWMIEKGSLEDEIFLEPIFSCMCKELNDLQFRTYETVAHTTVHNMEIHGRLDISQTMAVDSNDVGTSGAKDSGNHQDHLVLPDGIESDAMQPEGTNAADARVDFDSHMPSDIQVNNVEGVTEQLIENEKETAVVTANMSDSAQVDSLDKECLQDVPTDLQRSTNTDTPLFVLDDMPGSATRILDGPDVVLDSSDPVSAQAMDDMKGELNGIVHDNVNAFENKDMPGSEITGLEFTQNASGFLQPTEDENVLSAMGENSGLQENNAGSVMDLDNMGHDFALKECSDFGSAIQGVDTDFLNYDDEVDGDEANDDEPNPDEFQSLDNSGWSSRTRGVARYLKTLFDEESGLGRKSVAIDRLLSGKTRKEASRMFFETLVLTTKDFISVDQPNPFDFVSVKPGPKLLKSDF
ncbi:sister chromatid cohesion 1 protein 4 [Oryza brachyantha]|uniref:Rad21/Rec8-like protein N-terminal domain-containing protein n=1 Tax=Oryza brachyantha TaxID=4533 RepID=J3L6R0_ORYBR|nr:sister chromatid cohesion 1 protein 4 [Oryza brachyantha]